MSKLLRMSRIFRNFVASRNTCFVSIHFTFLLGCFRHIILHFGLPCRHDCSTVDSYYDTKTWRDALSTHKPLISIRDLQFRLVSINGRVRTMLDIFETLRVRERERREQRKDYRIEEKQIRGHRNCVLSRINRARGLDYKISSF